MPHPLLPGSFPPTESKGVLHLSTLHKSLLSSYQGPDRVLDTGLVGLVTFRKLSSSGRQSGPQTITVQQGRHGDGKGRGAEVHGLARGPWGSQGSTG